MCYLSLNRLCQTNKLCKETLLKARSLCIYRYIHREVKIVLVRLPQYTGLGQLDIESLWGEPALSHTQVFENFNYFVELPFGIVLHIPMRG